MKHFLDFFFIKWKDINHFFLKKILILRNQKLNKKKNSFDIIIKSVTGYITKNE